MIPASRVAAKTLAFGEFMIFQLSNGIIRGSIRSIVDVYSSAEVKHCFVRKKNELHEVRRLFNFVKNCLSYFADLVDVCWLQLVDNSRLLINLNIKNDRLKVFSSYFLELKQIGTKAS